MDHLHGKVLYDTRGQTKEFQDPGSRLTGFFFGATLKSSMFPRFTQWAVVLTKGDADCAALGVQTELSGSSPVRIGGTPRAGMNQPLVDHVEHLYEEHYDRLFRYMLRCGCSESQADDYVQEAFLRLFRFLKQGNTIEKPKYWLLRVLRNIQIDEGRLHSHEAVLDDKELEAGAIKAFGAAPDAESESISREWNESVQKAIAALPRKQYEYLLLRSEGLKLREIADLHGVSIQTVSEAIARAVDQIWRSTHE